MFIESTSTQSLSKSIQQMKTRMILAVLLSVLCVGIMANPCPASTDSPNAPTRHQKSSSRTPCNLSSKFQMFRHGNCSVQVPLSECSGQCHSKTKAYRSMKNGTINVYLKSDCQCCLTPKHHTISVRKYVHCPNDTFILQVQEPQSCECITCF